MAVPGIYAETPSVHTFAFSLILIEILISLDLGCKKEDEKQESNDRIGIKSVRLLRICVGSLVVNLVIAITACIAFDFQHGYMPFLLGAMV